MSEGDRTWSVWLHRDGGAESRAFRLDPRLAGAAALAVLLLTAGGGALLGHLAGRRAGSERVRELEHRLQELRQRQERTAALAARLDSVEAAYRRVRDLLGAGAGDGVPAPELPTSMASGDLPSSAGEPGSLPAGWPLARPGFVTRRFRRTDGAAGHPGLDVAVPSGSYVRAIQSGAVEGVGRDSVYGRFVRLAHDDGYRSLYGHASHVFVSSGETVERGQVIALSGNSGRSTAPHLHLEVEREGRSVDPLRFLGSVDAGRGTSAADARTEGRGRGGRGRSSTSRGEGSDDVR